MIIVIYSNKKWRLSEVVYGTAIAAHARTAHVEEAMSLLRSMETPTAVAYTVGSPRSYGELAEAVIGGLARLGAS